ncbi:hypothetical protein BDV93DRAFT_566204 [Ceratobasidium sp. AG-I]|nr:hypothetical protein BDV93DRAFT_566204 [Ceratobasidium sp. AG-I]
MSLMKSLKKDHGLPPMALPQGPMDELLTIAGPQNWLHTGDSSPVRFAPTQVGGAPADHQGVSLDVVQMRSYPAKATPESDDELVADIRAAASERLNLPYRPREFGLNSTTLEKAVLVCSNTRDILCVLHGSSHTPELSTYLKSGGNPVVDEWVQVDHLEVQDVKGLSH